MYMHNNHCHRATAHLQLIIIIIIIIIIIKMTITPLFMGTGGFLTLWRRNYFFKF